MNSGRRVPNVGPMALGEALEAGPGGAEAANRVADVHEMAVESVEVPHNAGVGLAFRRTGLARASSFAATILVWSS